MQTFIDNIFRFVLSIYTAIVNSMYSIGGSGTSNQYITFLDKQILDGTLISLGLTWRELFLYGFTWALVIFFIIFFVNIVFKVIKLICIR